MARSKTVGLGTIYVFNDNEEEHRLTFKGFGDRVVGLDELKTKRDKVAALLNRDGSQKWSGACVSKFFGWVGSRYAKTCWQDTTKSVVVLIACKCPALVAGGNTSTSAFCVEK